MGCSQEIQDAAVAACGQVAAHEQAFWQMAYEGWDWWQLKNTKSDSVIVFYLCAWGSQQDWRRMPKGKLARQSAMDIRLQYCSNMAHAAMPFIARQALSHDGGDLDKYFEGHSAYWQTLW